MPAQKVTIQEGTGSLVAALPFTDGEYRRRLDGVRAAMSQRGLDAFISFTPENIYYLTAHDSPGYYFYQASVVTQSHPPVNVLRRIETSNTLGRGWSRRAVGYEDRQDPIQATASLLDELGVSSRAVGAEGDAWFVSPRRYEQLGQAITRAGGRLVDASGIIEAFRVTKSTEELAYIRTGARIVERGMRVAIDASRAGTNENDVAGDTVRELIRAGSEYAGLPPFITSGPRTSLCHSTWAGRRYEAGDVLNYELPGVVNRYCASLFRCGTIGPPESEFRRRAAMVQESLERVIEAIRPGATSHEVHAVNKATFQKHGFGDRLGHRTGYSVGINYAPDWGEGHIMSIWDGDERPLRAGMTFHLVPGLHELGRYAITISDTVLVTESGCEVLTRFPREPFVA
jgi:Xaa-Pro aminopeptidase